MYEFVTVIHKGKFHPVVSKDEATRRLTTEKKRSRNSFSDKFGHVNVFMSFFPFEFVQTQVFLKLCQQKSIFSHEIKGKRLFF